MPHKASSSLFLLTLWGSAVVAQDVKPLPGASAAPAPSTSVAPSPSQTSAPQGEAKPAPADPFASIPPAKPEDVRSLDAIVAALYDVISGDAGVKRDWNRFRSLFYPGARMIPTGKNMKTGQIGARIASPEQYIEANRSFLEGEGFHEQEITRHVDSFGTIAQVFSVYQARKKLSDEKPFLRGINSIQLLNDGKRWWVMTVAWSPETAENSIPAQYLKKVER
jgi:hypothetical protein